MGSLAMKLPAYSVMLLYLILMGVRGAAANPDDSAVPDTRASVCLMIESAARASALPLDFFARIIWQESRFQPDAVGPTTRGGDRAQGIAQFMPGTAAERHLLDPLNPVEALPKAAAFLAELRSRFGNLGLAAAAYNAGPQRVRDFLSGARGLPAETRKYVLAVTGRSVEDWSSDARRQYPDSSERPAREPGPAAAPASCQDLAALLEQAPNRFVEELQQRINLAAEKPWGVEVGAGFSHDRVLTAYADLLRRFGEILSERDPTILSGVLRSRGSRAFYRVSIGAPTRAAANDLCAQIRRAGGACLVLRNRGQAG
jgi:Transglycosylase SLT domain/SPOR domain